MATIETPYCPECNEAFDFPQPPPVNRRAFLAAAGAVALGGTAALAADTPADTTKKPRPAEELIRELYSTLKDEQKKKVIHDFNHRLPREQRPARMGMYNAPIMKIRLRDVYTKAQQELVERIVKAMSSGDDGYRQISRGGTWDGSHSFDQCGALFFGEPIWGKKCAFVFAGHHMTIRCDADAEESTAFGGPIYYGHSPNGYSRGNIFNYQTRAVLKVHEALDGKQREKATIYPGNPGEMHGSIRFRAKAEDRPGLPITELSKDQRALVEQVMRDVLKPYRKEDVDEVMAIVKRNGGMDKIKLAFYTEDYQGAKTNDDNPWSFWRLDGPGFVWNFRVLPHVHTYVNISSKLV
jgi:hypothetical protein